MPRTLWVVGLLVAASASAMASDHTATRMLITRVDGLQAAIDPNGAHFSLDGVVASLRVGSVGRRGAMTDLHAATPIREGGEVRVHRAPNVTEWWRALPGGVEHGVVVATRPEGSGQVHIDLTIGEDLHAEARGEDTVALVDRAGIARATYGALV